MGRLSDGHEEHGGCVLEAGGEEAQYEDGDAAAAEGYEGGVAGVEGGDELAGEELEGSGKEDGEEAGPGEGESGEAPDAIELSRSVVVAPEGLGSLGDADYGEDEEHRYGIDYADDGEGGLSAQAGHGVVGYDEHDEGEALNYGYGDAELEHRGHGRGFWGEPRGLDLEDAPMVLDEVEGEGCAEGQANLKQFEAIFVGK